MTKRKQSKRTPRSQALPARQTNENALEEEDLLSETRSEESGYYSDESPSLNGFINNEDEQSTHEDIEVAAPQVTQEHQGTILMPTSPSPVKSGPNCSRKRGRPKNSKTNPTVSVKNALAKNNKVVPPKDEAKPPGHSSYPETDWSLTIVRVRHDVPLEMLVPVIEWIRTFCIKGNNLALLAV